MTQRPTRCSPNQAHHQYSKLTSELPLACTHTSPQPDLLPVELPCHDSFTPFQPLVVIAPSTESHWTFSLQ